jgi:hypothetical protein
MEASELLVRASSSGQMRNGEKAGRSIYNRGFIAMVFLLGYALGRYLQHHPLSGNGTRFAKKKKRTA